ncbi:histidine phosphatase family protein [Patescibacteria group bacterium]|nr:histidine phosphatase family protein [Patescibacteria group bacterium]
MTNLVQPIISYLEGLAQHVPLELFTLIGTFIEEFIAPIPSPFVLATAGSITKAQNNPLIYLVFIAFIGSIGKTFGGWLLYLITDKMEDIFTSKFGKFIGITSGDIEKIGSYFNGTKRDWLILFLIRSFPPAPSSPVSITCGLIKIKMRTFLTASFLGNIIRNLAYLYIGYAGLAASEEFMRGMEKTESVTQIIVVGLLLAVLIWGYKQRKKFFSNGNGKTTEKEDLLFKYKHAIPGDFIEKHGKEKIIEGLKVLTYKNIDPLPKTKEQGHSTLYIFRHGESEDNLNLIFSGWRDVGITENGKAQAKILAPKLKDIKFEKLYASTQIRAIDTMKIAISQNKSVKNLEIIKDERIRERSYGDLEGTSKLEYYLKDSEGLETLRRDFYNIPPNGESLEIVCKRVAEFCDELVEEIKEKNINVAISCHGNSIRGFRKYFENLDNETVAKVETPLAQDYASYTIKD